MAKCGFCERDMLGVDGCDPDPNLANAVRYGEEGGVHAGWADGAERCHDCNCRRGQLHHPGCDVEECPECHCQMIGFHAPTAGSRGGWTAGAAGPDLPCP